MHNNIDLASTESDLHINSPRRHEEHEDFYLVFLRALRVFVVIKNTALAKKLGGINQGFVNPP